MRHKLYETVRHPEDASREIVIALDPTSLINVGDKHLPVIWKGTIDQHPVEIIQKEVLIRGNSLEFKQYPEDEYGFLKQNIIIWMDQVLKKYK